MLTPDPTAARAVNASWPVALGIQHPLNPSRFVRRMFSAMPSRELSKARIEMSIDSPLSVSGRKGRFGHRGERML